MEADRLDKALLQEARTHLTAGNRYAVLEKEWAKSPGGDIAL